MTREQEVNALTAKWKSEGWTDGEIQTSLLSYFEDSPTFVDDDGEE